MEFGAGPQLLENVSTPLTSLVPGGADWNAYTGADRHAHRTSGENQTSVYLVPLQRRCFSRETNVTVVL